MRDIISKNYIKNGKLIDSDMITGFDDQTITVIYEVIRVIDRVGVFLEDHLDRLEKSLKAANIKRPDELNNITEHIKILGETNSVKEFNIKIIISKGEEGHSDYAIYIMTSFYPGADMIKNGIHTEFMEWERTNPNTKTVNSNFKDTAAAIMEKYNAFELLLINSRNQITEGSRTNVFFVKGYKLITAPAEYILLGITRKYVLSACKKVGLTVVEELLHKDEINTVDGAFVCGTSLKVLPIASIGKVSIPSKSNKLVEMVIEEYNNIMNEYIKKYIKG